MGKHLTIEEKKNAEKEVAENRRAIKELKQKIYCLKARNKRLLNHIYTKNKSKYGGLYAQNSVCQAIFGMAFRSLSPEQKKEYYKIMKEKERSNNKMG